MSDGQMIMGALALLVAYEVARFWVVRVALPWRNRNRSVQTIANSAVHAVNDTNRAAGPLLAEAVEWLKDGGHIAVDVHDGRGLTNRRVRIAALAHLSMELVRKDGIEPDVIESIASICANRAEAA